MPTKKDRKPRTSPLEIDKKAIERLKKRVETLRETQTQYEVRGNADPAVLAIIGKEFRDVNKALSVVLVYLQHGDNPPEARLFDSPTEQSDE